MSRATLSLRTALAGVVLLMLGGCISIPSDGGLGVATGPGTGQSLEQQDYRPPPPQAGASREDIIKQFFGAMGARPMSTTVARKYLTASAAESWSPARGFLTYEGIQIRASTGRVTLTGVNRFDARGMWAGTPADDTYTVSLPTTPQDGQWRISSVPDLLMVNTTWFEQQTRPVNLYWFSSDGGIVVPEPVFLPGGIQLPTLLVRGLLEGPSEPRVERSYIPSGTRLTLGVTIDDGVAQVPLTGVPRLSPVSRERLAAQFAWTLRGAVGVEAVDITVDGATLAVPGVEGPIPIDYGAGFDASGVEPDDRLYGILEGRAVLVRPVSVDDTDPGREQQGSTAVLAPTPRLRSVASDLAGRNLAGVTRDGSRVVLAASADRERRVRTVVSGLRDPLAPVWDAEGRLWILDRTPDGAVVRLVVDGEVGVVDVPGVSGADVTDFLVSRDGSRFVALVSGALTDQIRAGRVSAGDGPADTAVTPTTPIVPGPQETETNVRIRDMGWLSPTRIQYIQAVPRRQSQLLSAFVDGSPSRFDPDRVDITSNETYVRVVGSPRPDDRVYLQRSDGVYVSDSSRTPPLPEGVTAVGYAG